MTIFLTPLDALISKMPSSFFFPVFRPHVSLMQTVCPRNGLTEELHPPGRPETCSEGGEGVFQAPGWVRWGFKKNGLPSPSVNFVSFYPMLMGGNSFRKSFTPLVYVQNDQRSF